VTANMARTRCPRVRRGTGGVHAAGLSRSGAVREGVARRAPRTHSHPEIDREIARKRFRDATFSFPVAVSPAVRAHSVSRSPPAPSTRRDSSRGTSHTRTRVSPCSCHRPSNGTDASPPKTARPPRPSADRLLVTHPSPFGTQALAGTRPSMFALTAAPRCFAAPVARAGTTSSTRSNVRAASRSVRANASAAPPASKTSEESFLDVSDMPVTEFDENGVERVLLQTQGWDTWVWKGHACNYISAGVGNTGPIVVLVHGFGAHSYHWRYTIPALARRGCRVYALCMLGYGWSPKVTAPYSMEFWGDQVIDFSREVAGSSESDKAVIAGNSIGALAALYAASNSPETTKGLCLVNRCVLCRVSPNPASLFTAPGRVHYS
jgi:hypothetical protein